MWNAPSHRAVHQLRNSAKFREKIGVPTPQLEVKPKEEFYADLKNLNFQNFNIWETEYLQLLSGSHAVFEWLLGTTLRPIMAQLDATEQQEFGTDLKELLAKEYPQLSVTFFFFIFLFLLTSLFIVWRNSVQFSTDFCYLRKTIKKCFYFFFLNSLGWINDR
jgi:trans-aconitate 2-methyltransferase